MKKLILFTLLFSLGIAVSAQSVLRKGMKLGDPVSGTSIITVDSLTQFSTDQYKLFKGATQLQPYIPENFKIGSTVVLPTAAEINNIDGTTSNVQTQLDGKVSVANGWDPSLTYAKITYVDTSLSRLLGVDSLRYDLTSKRFKYLASDRWYTIAVQDSTALPSTLLNDLYGYWKLDEASGAIVDVLGSHNGTNSGALANQSGKFGTAYTFDTNTDYLYVPIATNPPVGGDFTVSFWTKFTTLSVTQSLGGSTTAAFALHWSASLNSSNQILVSVRNSDNTTFSYNTGVQSLSTDTWYMITVVFPGTINQYPKIYLNDTYVALTGTPTAFTGTPRTPDYRFAIGNTLSGTTAINGSMDDFGFWLREVTQAEITYKYNSATGRTHPFTLW